MIETADFRNGLIFKIDNDIYTILWFQHHKPGKGGAVMRTKIRNMRTGTTTERTFKSGEKFEDVSLDRQKKQYLYSDEENCHFMDEQTGEQISVDKKKMEGLLGFMKEGTEVEVLYLDDEFLGVELPVFVELRIEHTEPGMRGDTVSNTLKPATLETGAEIRVPLFINQGDLVKVDTRTGEYAERLKG